MAISRELIALKLTTWIPVIVILLQRISAIEKVMDEEAGALLNQMENFLSDEARRPVDSREQRLIFLLSDLPAWRFHAIHGEHRWNPTEEPLHDFAKRHGSIVIFESPDLSLGPWQVIGWLYRLHDSLHA